VRAGRELSPATDENEASRAGRGTPPLVLLPLVLNGRAPSFADARRTRDELAPAVGHGRLPLCLSNEQDAGTTQDH
jgi:hypothetical protein